MRKMPAFGSTRIATAVVMLFLLSLVQSMPNKDLKKEDYADDGEYDEDSIIGSDDDDPTQPADVAATGPVHVRSRALTINARPGDTVEFPCVVDNAEDTVITWLRDNTTLFVNDQRLSDDFSRYSRADNLSLLLHNATEKDSSDHFRCQILVKPPIEIVHKLRVIDEPRELWNIIEVKPARHVEVTENETVTFGCETRMEPKPEIKWSHKGERLHNGEVLEEGGNFITIKKATRHHAGRYQCLAENSAEKPAHDAVEVVVNYTPVIDVEHEIVHTGTGIKSELTCIVHAHPRADVTWHKNRKPIVEKYGRRAFVGEKPRHTLVIEHTSQHDLGQYTCTARNPVGGASRTIELTGVPSRPRFYGGAVAEDESILILKWRVESYAPITEYKLEYRREGETTWTTVSPRVTNGRGNQFMAEHSLVKLQPGSYEAKLMARNEYGWSQHSTVHTFREEYKSEEALKGSATTCRALTALVALLIFRVLSSEAMCP